MKMQSIAVIFCLLSSVVFGQSTSSQAKLIKDIVYKTVDGWEGRLDLYLPAHKNKNTLVFYIHGGGWVHGKKEEEYEKIKVFIDSGFTVANVEYRLAKQAPAPAAIEDVNCALAYLINHAARYHIDRAKIIVIGASAGGHLALLLGLQSAAPVYTGGCRLHHLKIAGIISKYGPTDLMTWKPARSEGSASSAWLGDRVDDTSFIRSLSPVNYVTPKIRQIPVLFIHGNKDKTVPVEQAKTLYQKLKDNGNKTILHIVDSGGHGNFRPLDNKSMNEAMVRFVRACVNR